jgi:hypothetical protein
MPGAEKLRKELINIQLEEILAIELQGKKPSNFKAAGSAFLALSPDVRNHR